MLTISAVVYGAGDPPFGCRTVEVASSDTNPVTYECILCGSTAPALREGVTYLVNGDCTFEPIGSPITFTAPVIVTDDVTIRPLDVQQPVEIIGQLLIRGNDVTIQDLYISSPLDVSGSEVLGFTAQNITVTESVTALKVSPSNVDHDINITGLSVTDLSSLQAGNEDVTALEPIVVFFHTYGNVNVFCGEGQLVIVQPMLPSGTALFAGCEVINFTAILDAYGNAFTYDMYGTPVPQWVNTMQSWAITLTAVSAGLLLLSRNPKSAAETTTAPAQPTQSAWI